MSQFAFGTYRISDYNPQHIDALKEAIKSGIRMIDTSTNYLDGSAERAIALALREFDTDMRESVEIVSKFGYIQGETLLKHHEKAFEEVVEYSESCYHSIARSFLKEQLTQSLKRLELTTLDCYLIHNPEYYLLDAINKKIDKDTRLDEMYRRLYEAFIGLEEEVKNGRILSYGISSNSFSKPIDHEEFLPYEDLLDLAQKASQAVGNAIHHFTTIELPINMLETEGLKCASWAKENGLRVLANRPLNAQKEQLMYRLADYDESSEYYHHLNELLDVCDNDLLRPLYNLIEQLDDNKHKFGWIGDYEAFLFAQIIPHMKKTLEKVDEANRDTMLHFIELFLTEYKKMVAYECSKHTRTMLKEELKECFTTMQECAIKFLLAHEQIDYILVGMRKPSYVHQIVSFEN
ncbi:MAG: aldo/keto reductase [Sulfurimonas sp.]|jgi:aryl-alcohol dehydrogenase-like predicted oxidoreductase|nr:aldo/keto reductase [Sulfurimonas sp.]